MIVFGDIGRECFRDEPVDTFENLLSNDKIGAISGVMSGEGNCDIDLVDCGFKVSTVLFVDLSFGIEKSVEIELGEVEEEDIDDEEVENMSIDDEVVDITSDPFLPLISISFFSESDFKSSDSSSSSSSSSSSCMRFGCKLLKLNSLSMFLYWFTSKGILVKSTSKSSPISSDCF